MGEEREKGKKGKGEDGKRRKLDWRGTKEGNEKKGKREEEREVKGKMV